MTPIVKTLKNGARIIYAHDPNTRTVAIVPGIHVGSRYESKSTNGLSHLIEHMLFKGTKKYDNPQTLSRAIDRLGGYLNASTDREMTDIQVLTANAYEMVCVDIAMELLTAPLMRAEDMARERPVVCDEIKKYEADDEDRGWNLAYKSVFGDHTLGWPIAGYVENVRDVSDDNLRQFYTDHYAPGRIVVTLAGNYSEKAQQYVEERLLGLSGSAEDMPYHPAPVTPVKAGTLVLESITPRAALHIGFAGPTDVRARTAMSLVGNILGGYMSSRLFIELREKLSLCYSVAAALQPRSDASTLFAYMEMEPEKLTEAVTHLGIEFRRILTDITDEELESAKSHVCGGLVIANESSLHVATTLTHDLLIRNRVETTEETVERYNSITLDEVRVAASTCIRNTRTALVAPAECLDGFEELCANELGSIGA